MPKGAATKPLTDKEIDEIVDLYEGGRGQTVADLARAYRQTPAAVRYALKRRGELANQNRSDDMSADQSDEALGIGLDGGAAPDPIAALLVSPAMQAAIQKAVEDRVAQMAQPNAGGAGFADLAASLKHMVEMSAMQQPGYIKPIPVEELDRRTAGLVEMKALLASFEARGDDYAPQYEIGDHPQFEGFFECTNAIEYHAGDQIRTFLPPCVNFIPMNDEAEQVHRAMMTWIGDETPDIGERLRDAQLESKLPPMVSSGLNVRLDRGPVQKVQSTSSSDIRSARDSARGSRAPKRSLGTIVAEPKERSIPSGGVPVGPAFA